ncbi:hypothetical protein RUM44_007653 [Polyplax serrata]|uniref:Uncharacterized protein n=1 Tax=Polyplax serrata TaxID=468196 RepID=A0ABR1B807_POLSC
MGNSWKTSEEVVRPQVRQHDAVDPVTLPAVHSHASIDLTLKVAKRIVSCCNRIVTITGVANDWAGHGDDVVTLAIGVCGRPMARCCTGRG